jgi:hypothetical protein
VIITKDEIAWNISPLVFSQANTVLLQRSRQLPRRNDPATFVPLCFSKQVSKLDCSWHIPLIYHALDGSHIVFILLSFTIDKCLVFRQIMRSFALTPHGPSWEIIACELDEMHGNLVMVSNLGVNKDYIRHLPILLKSQLWSEPISELRSLPDPLLRPVR